MSGVTSKLMILMATISTMPLSLWCHMSKTKLCKHLQYLCRGRPWLTMDGGKILPLGPILHEENDTGRSFSMRLSLTQRFATRCSWWHLCMCWCRGVYTWIFRVDPFDCSKRYGCQPSRKTPLVEINPAVRAVSPRGRISSPFGRVLSPFGRAIFAKWWLPSQGTQGLPKKSGSCARTSFFGKKQI